MEIFLKKYNILLKREARPSFGFLKLILENIFPKDGKIQWGVWDFSIWVSNISDMVFQKMGKFDEGHGIFRHEC